MGNATSPAHQVSGQSRPRVADQCCGPRQGRWLPRRRHGKFIGRGEVEQGAEECHASDPVDHGVMDLKDDGPSAVFHALDQPRPPQRSVPVEPVGHEFTHQGTELGTPAWGGQSSPMEMVGQIEVWVVDPDGPTQVEWDPLDALAVARDQVELGVDEIAQFIEAREPAVEHAGASDVHLDLVIFQKEKLVVQCAQSVHPRTSSCSDPGGGPPSPEAFRPGSYVDLRSLMTGREGSLVPTGPTLRPATSEVARKGRCTQWCRDHNAAGRYPPRGGRPTGLVPQECWAPSPRSLHSPLACSDWSLPACRGHLVRRQRHRPPACLLLAPGSSASSRLEGPTRARLPPRQDRSATCLQPRPPTTAEVPRSSMGAAR